MESVDRKAQAMADFGDDEYQEMVCVEAGNVGGQQNLPRARKNRVVKSGFKQRAVAMISPFEQQPSGVRFGFSSRGHFFADGNFVALEKF